MKINTELSNTVSPQDFHRKKQLTLFAAYYRPEMKLFALDMSCAFFVALIELSYPMITRYILSEFLPDKQYAKFFVFIVIMLLGFLMRAGLQFVVTYWGHIMGANIEMRMRYDLFTHIQTLSYRFFNSNRTGQLMSRILPELFEITELAHHGPEDLFISFLTLIGAAIALFFISPKLAILVLLLMPFLIVFTMWLRKRMGRASRRVKESTAVINTELESCLSGIRISTAFANEASQANKFQTSSAQYRQARAGFYKIMATFFSGMEFMIGGLGVVAIGYGGYLIMRNEMDVVDLIAFTLYIGIFTTPIRKLTTFTELYQAGMSGFQRFVELMKEVPDIVDDTDAIAVSSFDGDIEFMNVSFSYNDEENAENVLENLNLHIRQGRTTAIVGPSGSGKTTLCHLIPRFYDVRSGVISIDGIDVKRYELASLRKNIGIVQQDVFLFAGNIRENIRFGRLSAQDDDVEAAAKQADLHDFIMTLPEGYDTIVGERGVRLSGGQKQRISIARVILKDPSILILDEATSALDNETEKRIQSAIARLSVGRTCVVIAHRLTTIRGADCIVYLDEKGIREQGDHESLMAASGYYYHLYASMLEHRTS
jgi:ATP-binding cassette subfamily B protein